MAGSIALTAIAGIVLGLAAGALGVIVQGVVVSEVAHAAVAEKLTLRGLWQRVKPGAWRLIGYSLLPMLTMMGRFPKYSLSNQLLILAQRVYALQ